MRDASTTMGRDGGPYLLAGSLFLATLLAALLALVEEAHARCLDIHPYTVNETAEMQKLIALGVDGIFTNFPDRLEAVLGKSAANGKPGAKLAMKASEACRSGL